MTRTGASRVRTAAVATGAALSAASTMAVVPVSASAGTVPAEVGPTAGCFGRQATVTGSNRALVRGTPGPDVIVVRDVTRVEALGGDDRICVLGIREVNGFRVLAGAGDDRVDTRAITGSGSHDTRLGPGDDLHLGSLDPDILESVSAGDEAAPGRDVVRLGPGQGTVFSGVPGRTNPDVVDLGRGFDSLFLQGRPTGTLRSGSGTLSITDTSRVRWRIDLAAQTIRAGADRGRVVGFSDLAVGLGATSLRVRGTAAADALVLGRDGGVLPLDVDMGGGDDLVSTRGRVVGRVDLGGGDFDTLALGGVTGGRAVPYRGAIDADLGAGRIRSLGQRLRAPGVEAFSVSGFRSARVVGGARDDVLLADGCRVVASGRSGADVLTFFAPDRSRCGGRAPSTELRGGPGDDRLRGGRFADVLVGGPGFDVIRDGSDTDDDMCSGEDVRGC